MYKIGQIVNYKLTEDEQKAQRALNGNTTKILPGIIVAVWGDTEQSCVNLKVLLDGPGELWITSVQKGEGERQFTV